MKKQLLLALIAFLLQHCSMPNKEIVTIKKADYELTIATAQKAVLVLFPCFPCDIENTKTEAKFLQGIEKEGITTLLLNINRKLYLSESEKTQYAELINNILDEHKVKKENVVIGGFSSGGNLSVILSNFLIKTKNAIQPQAVFAIDSPFDLEALYNGAQSDLIKKFNEEAVQEGQFIIELFENSIGKPSDNIEQYKQLSPYLISCNSINNIEYLTHTKLRFYCEPALDWQMKYKNRAYEDLNAHKLEKAYEALLGLGSKKAEFIKTENKGIRANGDRNPHAWSIVERDGFVKWILDY